MNDKELLMMAAKAAGAVGEYVENYPPSDYYAEQYYSGNECGILTGSLGRYHVWNPLSDDGDALRLAVKLEMDIEQYAGSVEVGAYYDGDFINTVSVEIADCRLFATRRAIVRAAAEIGGKL